MRKERRATRDELITDPQEAMRLLSVDCEIGLDLETSGLSPWRDTIAVVSMYGETSDTTAVLHVRGHLSPELRAFLSRTDVTWVGHNVAGFDMLFLANNGVDVWHARYFDTLIAEQVTLTTGRRDVRVNLADTIARRLGTTLKKGQGDSSWMTAELTDEQYQYCASDVYYLITLMREQLAKVAGTTQEQAMVFEQSIIPALARMMMNGMPMDRAALERWRKEMVIRAAASNQHIHRLWPGLNVNSSAQLDAAYYGLFNFSLPMTEKGNPQANKMVLASILEGATDIEAGETLSPIGQFTQAIQIAKEVRTRHNFYDDEWVAKFLTADGRIHPKFWQASTDTFRFSSSDPNMQQVPKEGRAIFGGVYGHSIVAVDYSQLEVRVAAYLANDATLITALTSDTDLHTFVASLIFHVAIPDVTKQQRQWAKAATFTLLFGGSAMGLVSYALLRGYRLDEHTAESIVLNFFRQFRGLAVMREKARRRGLEGRPVTITLGNGAKRVLMPVKGKVKPSQILNTMVQSGAAIGMKHAILEAHNAGLTEYLGLTVHDELVGCVPDAQVPEFTHELKRCMIEGMRNITEDTPIAVEEKIGTHWS